MIIKTPVMCTGKDRGGEALFMQQLRDKLTSFLQSYDPNLIVVGTPVSRVSGAGFFRFSACVAVASKVSSGL